MTNHFRTQIAALSLALCCVVPEVDAAKPEFDEPERIMVRQALQSETAAEPNSVNRREALQPTLRPATKSDPMWWQSGYVKVGNDWRAVEQSAVSAEDNGLVSEYRQQRAAAPKSADGQFALANWCRSHKLPDQERAHLMQTLLLAEPNRDVTTIHERLNHKRIGEQWIASRELAELEQQARDRAKAMELWMPKAERISRNLDGNEKQRRLAAKELEEINDAQAIPALTSTLASRSEASAQSLVEVLSRIPAYEGTQGLANLALFAQWASVRRTATESLVPRKMDDYVPELMGLLHRPPNVSQRNQRQGFELVVLLEGHQSVRAARLDLEHRETVRFVRGTGPVRELRQATKEVSQRGVEAYFAWMHSIDEIEDAVDFINGRVGTVLATVSGEKSNSDSEHWWNWWAQVNGNDPPADKPVNVVVSERGIGEARETLVRRHSCLVAGTPIWTDRGLSAVEKIVAGDCVLAKNIETGELAYKPVIHTTVRLPVPVRKFVVDGNPIVASSGHNFWVSGSGWTKTRELIPQQPIHTAIGMARVESVEDEAEPAPVYNLVVADFHTYFVGPAMILSHDVLPPRPTNVKVPGLAVK